MEIKIGENGNVYYACECGRPLDIDPLGVGICTTCGDRYPLYNIQNFIRRHNSMQSTVDYIPKMLDEAVHSVYGLPVDQGAEVLRNRILGELSLLQMNGDVYEYRLSSTSRGSLECDFALPPIPMKWITVNLNLD